MKNLRKSQSRLKSSIILLVFLFLPFSTQAQDWSITSTKSNHWITHCKTCHESGRDLAIQVGKRTEQYLFNFIHSGDDNHQFGIILGGKSIQDLARYVYIWYYLSVLERDMEKFDQTVKGWRLVL